MWFVIALTFALIAAIWSPWLFFPIPAPTKLGLNQSMVGAHMMHIAERLHIDFRHDESDERILVRASLGMNFSDDQGISCNNNDPTFSNVSCYWEHEGNRVQITMLPVMPRLKCTNFVWVAVSYKDVLKDCFRLRDAHWYGGGTHFDQSWPIEKIVRTESPFVSGDFVQSPYGSHQGSVGERFWLSSKGVAIVVNPFVPLFVSMNQSNDGRLCLVGKNEFPFRNTRRAPPSLDYTVCVGNNLLSVYKDVYKMFYSFPVNVPDHALFVKPIWSTRANFRTEVDQKKIELLAYEIDKHEYPRGLLTIDDKWEYCYGDFVFDMDKFPEPETMMRKLEMQGFSVGLWIHPFGNDDCVTYKEGVVRHFWVSSANSNNSIKNGSHDEVGRVRWWNGRGGMVDVTNSDAVKWWIGRVKKLQSDFGVFSFRFDAGETTWLPIDVKLSAVDDAYPNVYTTKYAEMIGTSFGRSSEVRVGYRTQNLPIFVRMMDKNSVWDEKNGLRTIIPTVLHFGLMGYPFVLPDVVGGMAHEPDFPSRELFVRWFQLNAFLPAVQISVVPWSDRFDDRVIYMCRKALKLRARFAPLIVSLAQESSRSGSPIVRPIWWIAPSDPDTYDIDSQFLVGDSLLVAPILYANTTRRDIYLPKGFWYDELRDFVHRGPQWLRNYKMELSEIAFFLRIPKPTVNDANRL